MLPATTRTEPKTISITAIIDLKLLILLSVKRDENLLAKSILKRSVTKYEMITIEKKEKTLKVCQLR